MGFGSSLERPATCTAFFCETEDVDFRLGLARRLAEPHDRLAPVVSAAVMTLNLVPGDMEERHSAVNEINDQTARDTYKAEILE